MPQQKKPTTRATTASKTSSRAATAPANVTKEGGEIAVTNSSINKDEYVEKINPDLSKLAPLPTMKDFEEAQQAALQAEQQAELEAAREKELALAEAQKNKKVVYKPISDRDPTLSPDDALLLKGRLEQRRREKEAEQRRKAEAERRRIAELERQRQLELDRLRDPSREIRGKIKISGIVGKEVFIGSKVYTVGQSVLGAKIIAIQPDGVVFMYKGQRFTKKVKLQ